MFSVASVKKIDCLKFVLTELSPLLFLFENLIRNYKDAQISLDGKGV